MIKRYSVQECCVGFDVIWEDESGKYVKYKKHIAVVEKLKAEIEQAALARLDEEYQAIYNKGYDDGRWAGYHELNQDFGVVDKEELTK